LIRAKYASDTSAQLCCVEAPKLPLNLPEPRAGFFVFELSERVFEAEHFRGWQLEPWQELSGSKRCPSFQKFEHGNAQSRARVCFSFISRCAQRAHFNVQQLMRHARLTVTMN
jgi:hypothetical protein